MSPQVGSGFNRDYWARFEKFVKDLVKRSDGVYIATGPLYLPSPDGVTGKWMMNHPMIGV
jgi:DNA/RNA endonuclease G (NUC1)